jgi:ubiquinone/menaquinone biosynthesis C-methylase UbiE
MSSLSKYFLDNYESDISRFVLALQVFYLRHEDNMPSKSLNAQYTSFKIAFGYSQPVPPEINISHVSKAIDIATGTGAWALDFASLPDVRNRNVQIFACDISTAKFPPEEERKAKGINFFQQDVTELFPDELLGTFDLVNLMYLSYSLTENGWKKALKNIHGLLSE